MRVLVVTHEASLSGAPKVALLAARALTSQGHVVSVVSRRPGPIEDDFRRVGDFVIEPFYRVRRRLWRTTGLRHLAWPFDSIMALLSVARRRPDLVFINSTASLAYLRPALWLRRSVIVHSHESAPVARLFVGPSRTAGVLRRVTLSACTPATRADLAELAGVPVEDVALLRSVPDSDRLLELSGEGDLAYPRIPGETVIGCCGTVERRKGADLWLRAEALVRAARPDRRLRFVWIGEVDPEFEGVAPDRFVGPQRNPYRSMQGFDIATLPSRDDPFPLVVMESMWLGRPVVAFDVGGVAEQVGPGGIVVPPEDVEAFAAAVVTLIDDHHLRDELGKLGAERAAALYSAGSFSAPLLTIVDSVVQGAPP